MITTHILKVVPPYFEHLLDGTKTFELRRNDRGFQRGDVLILWEYNPTEEAQPCQDYDCGECEHRAVRASVGFVYTGDPRHDLRDGIPAGWAVLSLVEVEVVEP